MAMRAAANQFGYLVGAAAGGLALAAGGFAALGAAFSGLFLLAVLIHAPVRWPRARTALRPATAA
jgi:predicted MFS family arabinose efflux permease